MKTTLAILLMAGLFAVSAHADRLGTDGTSRAFDADYENVWNAALVALDDKTIDTANKDIGQIVTKVETGSNLLGDKYTTIIVKIGHAKPCKVMVHVNISRKVQAAGLLGTVSSDTTTYSDDDKEKDILDSMDKALKAK